MKFPLVLFLISVFAFDQVDAQFTWGNPFPHGNRINDISIVNDSIMTVSDFGLAYSTDNFIDWYFNNLEFETAKESIKGFSFVNNEIGYAVGFNSHNYFTKSFKKQYGMSPTDFIRENIDSF